MIIYMLLAIFNGIVIGTSRAINSRLSVNIGPWRASFWNHMGGFIFLIAVFIFITRDVKFNISTELPYVAYLGGFFGALFVVVNSYVFPRIGAIKTIILVISGQMISSVILDYENWNLTSIVAQLLGIAFILLGVYLANAKRFRGDKKLIEETPVVTLKNGGNIA